MYRYVVTGGPRVKKNTQKVVRLRNGRTLKIDSKAYHSWHKEAIKQLDAQEKPSQPIDYPINLQCRFFMDTAGKVDLSALYEGIQDVMVEVGILADDNYLIVTSHDGSGIEVDTQNPRMEITITKKQNRLAPTEDPTELHPNCRSVVVKKTTRRKRIVTRQIRVKSQFTF